jgi:hypothetical protein
MRSLVIAIAAALLVVPTASAAWSLSAIGSAAARAKALGTGNIPSATVSGKKVTVTWSASTFSDGGNVAGYVVRRYNASTGVVQTIGASCTGTIAGLTCTERNTPAGGWNYTVTPAVANWRGGESAKSTTVTV